MAKPSGQGALNWPWSGTLGLAQHMCCTWAQLAFMVLPLNTMAAQDVVVVLALQPGSPVT